MILDIPFRPPSHRPFKKQWQIINQHRGCQITNGRSSFKIFQKYAIDFSQWGLICASFFSLSGIQKHRGLDDIDAGISGEDVAFYFGWLSLFLPIESSVV